MLFATPPIEPRKRRDAPLGATCVPISAPALDLSALPRRRLSAMRRAADELFAVLEAFERARCHPVQDLLAASSQGFTSWSHYPSEDVADAATGSAWYYHAHDETDPVHWNEHGHFHCFRHASKARRAARAIALSPDRGPDDGGLVHLVAVAVGIDGVPSHLFTLNRWASNECMYEADEVLRLADGFAIRADRRFALVSRWLSAMLRLFHPQIGWLLRERDRVLAERRAIDPAGFSEDTSLQFTSIAAIDLDAQLAALQRA